MCIWMKIIIIALNLHDETSASICIDGKVMNNIIATQSIHKEYGGVVPELASRAHQKNIIGGESALKDAGYSDLTAIAVTQGPGLLGALMVGYSYAKVWLCIKYSHYQRQPYEHTLAHLLKPSPNSHFFV